jgi:N-hydroxyarylamine O-acetyltransferase
VLDLDAYMARIGVSGRPGIGEVHRAQLIAVPFENLDPQRGVPVSLATDDLERKLVSERRGGYCFELNLLLKASLEALGAGVEPMLARVRIGSEPGAVRPRSHLVLRVRGEGGTWLTDVGFGRGGLLDPVPFGVGGPYEQSGWRYRVVEDGAELVLQAADADEWVDLYGFVPEPAPFVDLETSNWFTSTHPNSPFVTGLIVCAHRPAGRRRFLRGFREPELTEESPAGSKVTPVALEAIPGLLASEFGLEGFAFDAGGDRLVPVADG